MNFTELKTWEPKFTKGEGISVICSAPRKSGKSTFLKWLFDNYFNNLFDFFVVFSETANDNDFWADFLPDSNSVVFDKFKASKLLKLAEFQRSCYRRHNCYLDVLIILDDITNAKNNKSIIDIYNLGRHTNQSVYVIAQTATMIHPQSRNNTDLGIFFRQNTGDANEMLVNNFVGDHLPTFMKKKDKLEMISNIPRYNAFILDNLATNLAPHERLRRFKVPLSGAPTPPELEINEKIETVEKKEELKDAEKKKEE